MLCLFLIRLKKGKIKIKRRIITQVRQWYIVKIKVLERLYLVLQFKLCISEKILLIDEIIRRCSPVYKMQFQLFHYIIPELISDNYRQKGEPYAIRNFYICFLFF